MEKDVDDIILKYALKNAVDFGSASEKAVIAKVLGENPKLRARAQEVIIAVQEVIEEINGWSNDKREERLIELWPDAFEKKGKPKEKTLPPLPDAVEGKVVTRLPPEPNGYIHIGHGLSFMYNWLYKKMYDGKLILRFDDTDPRKEEQEYYDAIKDDIRWLGIEWDMEKNSSDDMTMYYKFAEQLLEQGDAYICECKEADIKKHRFDKTECKCRSKKYSHKVWKDMLAGKYDEGDYAVRFKGDMKSDNTVMRDPALLRVVKAKHPIQGNKYEVWPLYDFACAIEDSILGITHVLRSNEFAFRIELQNEIRERLKLRSPVTLQYSRFNMEGAPCSKRILRPLVDDGKVCGWDDIRLVTIKALRRRGILPDTIKQLAIELGMSTSAPTISWDNLFAINRKLLDASTNRYFFVEGPVEVKVKNAPGKEVNLKLHPSFEERGFRRITTGNVFYIAKKDAEQLKKNDQVRLKDLYNIRIDVIGSKIFAEYAGNATHDLPKIQWVTGENVKVKVNCADVLFKGEQFNEDSLKVSEGLAENTIENLKIGDIVQFERWGFVRLDSKDGDTYVFNLAHR